jgi:MFS transporter, PPP family, 3-phenylpropionic acid transporter
MSRVGLAAFWSLFMGGWGATFPFLGLYFRENAGLSGTEVGIVLGALPLVGLVAQPVWGQLSDRTGSRSRTLGLVCLAAGVSYLVVPLARGFAPILGVMALSAGFSTAVGPLATAVTLGALGSAGLREFGRVRVWGTVAFGIVVVAFPFLLDALERAWELQPGADGASEPALGAIFVATGVAWIAASALVLRLPRSVELAPRAARGEWRELLRSRSYRRVVLFTFGAFLCFQGPMMLFPIWVRSLGGDADTVSRLWIPMLALEVPLVAWAGQGLDRIGARGLVTVGILAGALRWTICAFATNPWVVYPAQLLHGVTVAGLVVGAPLYVEQCVSERLRSTAQGALAMLGFGLGGVVSTWLSGIMLDRFGATSPSLAGGIGGFALAALLPFFLPRPVRSEAR